MPKLETVEVDQDRRTQALRGSALENLRRNCDDYHASSLLSATADQAVKLLWITMTSPILRALGAVAGLGSAVLCWFLGSTLASPLRNGKLLAQTGAQYALLAFLFVPALIMAVVALFWVPPRVSGQGPVEGRRWRAALAQGASCRSLRDRSTLH